jgi:signal transduction histidine kinase
MPTGNIVTLAPGRDLKVKDSPVAGDRKRLHVFIRENIEPIVSEWESFAKTLIPSATGMTPLALRDHIHQILEFITNDVTASQTARQQARKSRGKKAQVLKNTAAETHAALRLAGGFDVGQMVSEYRALRASVIRLWTETGISMDAQDMKDLTRFHESIDQELAESVNYYSAKVTESKDMFAGILGHDLRSPLQGITLSAGLMLHMGTLNERQTMLTTKMLESANRMNVLINSLLDVTRARFGAGLQISPAPMDMGFVAHQLVDEFRVVHPARSITLEVSGNVRGEWDKARVGQVFSNLIGNAVQYGFTGSSVGVSVRGEHDLITVTVHNIGTPIPPGSLKRIFNPLTRSGSDKSNHHGSMNLGLGLFITEEVVTAHGGTIHVTSSEETGTTFTARFPRTQLPPKPARQLRQG